MNEPWCAAFLGYASGEHAPGRQEPAASLHAAHHLLLGHGLAAQAIRAGAGRPQVALCLNVYPVGRASDSEADRDAQRRIDGLQNRFFLDAVLLGRYPADVLDDVAPLTDTGHVRDGDLGTIAQPLDALGLNYYNRLVAAAGVGDPAGKPGPAGGARRLPPPFPGSEHVGFVPQGRPRTAMDWEIDAGGLTEVLLRVGRDYPAPPLYVMENGAAFVDTVSADGRVHDGERTAYLASHLAACRDATAAGADLRGYFVWSFLDNFEWAWGYDMRFGMVYVDFVSQRRVLKDSALWYADSARRNAPAPLPGAVDGRDAPDLPGSTR
jgi:beta-glucosidase